MDDSTAEYTGLEAKALYNRLRIAYDPSSYSLKGTLITNFAERDILDNSYEQLEAGAENLLYEILKSKGFVPKRLVPEDCERENLCSVDTTIVKQDSLILNMKALRKIFGMPYLKGTVAMEAIVQLCVALDSSKSCAKSMLWATVKDGYTYDDIQDCKIFEKGLTEAKVYDLQFRRKILSEALSSKRQGMLKALLFSELEILWAVSTLKETYQEVLLKKLLPYVFGCLKIDKAKDLLKITDTRTRYNAFSKFIADTARDIGTYSVSDTFSESLMYAFIAYVKELSLGDIRVNYIRTYYTYVLKNFKEELYPELKEGSKSEDTLCDPIVRDMEKIAGATVPEKSSAGELFKIGSAPKRSVMGSPDHAMPAPSSAMISALDSINARFTDSKYKFTVEDRYDDTKGKEPYERLANSVKLVNKELVKRMKAIKTYNTGGKNPNKPKGKLDKNALYKHSFDKNIFYDNSYKQLESDLAFGIILDQSGSMGGKGIENGRLTLIVMHETLKALNINHCIIGHTSFGGDYTATIYRYQSFKEDKTYHARKNYALINANAKCGNCDSAALYYMQQEFRRVKNRDKFCVVFSDGSPTECSGNDLIKQIDDMEKEHITVIGVGVNFASISKYYKNYANGKNLKDMLDIVSDILQKYVLKKKE